MGNIILNYTERRNFFCISNLAELLLVYKSQKDFRNFTACSRNLEAACRIIDHRRQSKTNDDSGLWAVFEEKSVFILFSHVRS